MDLQNIDYETLEDLFNPIEKEVKVVKNLARNVCEECNVDQVIQDCFYVCPNCGVMDLEPLFYDIPYELNHLKRSFYKRRLYCIEKLNYIAGIKEPTHIAYRNMLKFLQKKQFKGIVKLKALMKKFGYHKYYKYIYNIYFNIKKVRLIKLTPMEIHKISLMFVKMDIKFTKHQEQHKRKNFMSYNSIIYLILKERKVKG
jgi:hypothetical protein